MTPAATFGPELRPDEIRAINRRAHRIAPRGYWRNVVAVLTLAVIAEIRAGRTPDISSMTIVARSRAKAEAST